MKRQILLIYTVLMAAGMSFSQEQGYEYKFKVHGIKDTVIYLAAYYGEKQYYKDTTEVDKGGNFVFKDEKPLPGGIYSIVMPDKKSYFEFVVNEPKFHMETKKGDLVSSMKVKGSKENQLFYEFQQFIAKKHRQAQPLREAYEKLKEGSNQDSLNLIKSKLGKIDKEVKEYKTDLIDSHKETFVSKLFSSSSDPEVPEAPILENGRKDSLFPYRYFKAHYLDNVDFSDDRLLRAPVMHNKISHYIKKLTVQHPDSIIVAADYLAGKAKANKEVFKYVVHYITNTYETSKIMGMDAVFVHMAENYYMTGVAHWIDSTQKAKISERAMKLKPLLVGKITPNVILPDTTETDWKNLHEIEAEYTILYFWDPDCGHCKKETPKLKKVYDQYKEKGVEVFAVCTEFETEKWKKYVRKNDLDWINVSDTPEINKNYQKYLQYTTVESLNFRDVYDIYATPQLYLLDKDKRIVAKKLGAEQAGEYLERMLKNKKELK